MSPSNLGLARLPRDAPGSSISTRAQSSSVVPPDRAAPRGATCGTGGGANRLYAISSLQEQENSQDVVTDILDIKNDPNSFIGIEAFGFGNSEDSPTKPCCGGGSSSLFEARHSQFSASQKVISNFNPCLLILRCVDYLILD
uniref:Uncharacterized protein n=1 Tax=Solanum tuberosum TaxID=4113 RepID=M1DJA8_SOLTU